MNKNGVAIVIVLGLMAVLMLAAVAFSISMRIERTGAGSFKHGVQARHLVKAALADAVNNIDLNLDGANVSAYPTWNVMNSMGTTRAHVLSQSAMAFIPQSLQAEARACAPGWSNITVQTTSGNEVVGRYAFIVVNCSGLLDANKVGGLARGGGTNAAEIAVAAPGDPVLTDRDYHRRYETLDEFIKLNPDFHDKAPGAFAVYSLTTNGQGLLSGTWEATNKVNIGGTEGDLVANQAQIVQALVSACSLSTNAANAVFTNLLDYVDTDCIPRDLASPSTEAVPMISELCVSNLLTFPDASTVQATPILFVEWHFPFTTRSTDKFDVYVNWRARLTDDAGGVTPWTLSPTGSRDSTYVSQVERFGRVVFPYTGSALTLPVGGANFVLNNQVAAWITLRGQPDAVVDAAPFPTNGYITLDLPAAPAPSGSDAALECIDPRFNWVQSGCWFTPFGVNNTIARTNSQTLRFYTTRDNLDNQRNDRSLQGTAIYVSNQGRLNSVGEIGNILRGWDMSGDLFRTIRLYPRNNANANKMDQVFRYFCVRDDQQRGAVNVNTRQAEALDSVFLNTPMGFPATNPSLPMLTAVGPLVDAITNATALGEFHDVGDVGTNTVNWRALFPSMDDVSREAIIANSAGLLTVRQNLFIIVLRAESWSPGIGGVGGETLAGAHAVAEVWRDPFRDEDGNHRMFIRYFKMLED